MILDFNLAPKPLICFACDPRDRREAFTVLVVIDGRAARFAACLQHTLAELAPFIAHEHDAWREAA